MDVSTLFILLSCAVFTKSYQITVDRLQYCKEYENIEESLECDTWVPHHSPHYRYWTENSVEVREQRDMYLSEVYRPPKSDVKQLVFLAPGQQFALIRWHQPISGTPAWYWNRQANWPSNQTSKAFNLSADTLPYQLMHQGHVSSKDTAFFLAFKHNFEYHMAVCEKRSIEEAYYSWLKSAFDPQICEFIFLAGFSRGGCLVMRLAKRFQEDFPHIKLAVNSYDGVCDFSENELGTVHKKLQNPKSYYKSVHGWKTHLDSLYPNRESGNLYILIVVGGYNPYGIDDGNWILKKYAEFQHRFGTDFPEVKGIRGFTYDKAEREVYEKCWIRQNWIDKAHSYLGRVYVIDNGVKDYIHSKNMVYNSTCAPPVKDRIKGYYRTIAESVHLFVNKISSPSLQVIAKKVIQGIARKATSNYWPSMFSH